MGAAKKNTRWLSIAAIALATGCFPDFDSMRGSLTVGLLGVDPDTDTLRVTVTAGTERFVTEAPITPAASVRIEVVPTGPVAVLAETLQGGVLLQSKGVNAEVGAGENELGIDFGSTGPDPPDEVRSAAQLVVVEFSDGSISGGRLRDAERIERDPFLAFLSAARSSLGGDVRVSRVVEATASTNGDSFDDLYDGPITLELVSDGGASVAVGTFAASGTRSTLVANDADVSPLDTAFSAGRFDVRIDGATTENQVETDVSIQIVFAATLR